MNGTQFKYYFFVKLSDDISWVEVHWITLKNLYLSMILQDENNFGEDNLLLDEVIELYKINCPNDCSGNGKCFKSNFQVLALLSF